MSAGGASAGVGPYVEVAFLHKASKTLLVTDAVVSIPPEAPQIVRSANLLEAGGPLPGNMHHSHLICNRLYLPSRESVVERIVNAELSTT